MVKPKLTFCYHSILCSHESMGEQLFVFSGSSFLVRGRGQITGQPEPLVGPRVGWGWTGVVPTGSTARREASA